MKKKNYFRSCFQCIPVYMCSYIQIHPHGKFQHSGKGSCNTALSLNYCEQKQDNKYNLQQIRDVKSSCVRSDIGEWEG